MAFFNDCTALYVYAHAATGTISGTRNQDEYTGRELHEDVVDEKNLNPACLNLS